MGYLKFIVFNISKLLMSITKLQEFYCLNLQKMWNEEFKKFETACLENQLDEEFVRKGYELSCLNDIQTNNFNIFQHHFACMKEHSRVSHLISRENIKIFSIHLLILLIDSRLSDFHTELENLPQYLLSNKFIRFVLNIEHSLNTGEYLKILKSKPPKAFKKVLEKLSISLRKSITSCMEKSYKQISSDAAIRLLQIKNQMDFNLLKMERN